MPLAYSYTDMLQPRNTSSGITEKVLLAPVRWFETIRIPTAPYANAGDRIKIFQSHKFITGKGFVQVRLAPDRNTLSLKTTGSAETQKFQATLNVFFAGTYSHLHETMMAMQNEPFIMLQQDAQCELDYWYQLGDNINYAWMKGDWESGTTAEGVKGYSCSFNYIGKSMLRYMGSIVTVGGTTVQGDFDPDDFDPADFLTG